MFNLCSCLSSSPQAGTMAYEVFSPVPKMPLGGLAEFLANGGNLQQFLTNFGSVGGLIRNIGTISQVMGGKTDQTGSLLNLFLNNVPQESVKGTDSNLKDLVDKNEPGVVKKVLKSNYSELVEKHKQSGGRWTDPDFPPDQSSIGNIDDLPVKAEWRRIPEVIRNAEFISDIIEPSDILQGSLGDCYFLSAISALAENDFRIKNLFPSLSISKHGVYMVRILYQGVLREVVVDDFVPVTPQNTPLFAKPAGGRQIWVMVLEKAWAKLHGSYGVIVGGLPNEVLHAFSGAPAFYHPIPTAKDKQEKLWLQMISNYKLGGTLCCGTKADPALEKAGLVIGHAYTILDIFDGKNRLVRLRNPWGKREWNGRASDRDTQFWATVPPAQKQRIHYRQKNDGIFFMLWEDFVNYFSMVDICTIDDNANYLSVEAEFDKKNGQVFEFETQGGKTTVALSQESLRAYGEEVQKKGYSRAIIVVSKYNKAAKGYEYTYIASTSGRNFADHYLEMPSLEAGKYVAFAKIDWISTHVDKATFSLYSVGKSTLIKSKQSGHDKLLFKTFLDHARKNKAKQILSSSPQEWVCTDFLMNAGGYGYMAFHLDQKSTRKLGVELIEKEFTSKRLVLKKPYKGQGKIKTMVEPGKQLIILYRMKSQNYPTTIALPTPKIYNLI